MLQRIHRYLRFFCDYVNGQIQNDSYGWRSVGKGWGMGGMGMDDWGGMGMHDWGGMAVG